MLKKLSFIFMGLFFFNCHFGIKFCSRNLLLIYKINVIYGGFCPPNHPLTFCHCSKKSAKNSRPHNPPFCSALVY